MMRYRPNPGRMLRLREVEQMIGRKRSSLYQDMAIGRFPKPIKIGARAVAWPEQELIAWLHGRIAQRDGDSVIARRRLQGSD
jgi:prophage regulatory protein